MNYEIIKFENGSVELEVNVSPEEETVWLNLNEMCLLFDRDKSVISRHIRRIFEENELEKNQVVAKNATTGTDGKTYQVEYYNLDVVISVGYRVKSKNGVMFRKWATSVLKEYLLKGYALNEGRTLITKDNYLNLVNRVDSLDARIGSTENTISDECGKNVPNEETLKAFQEVEEMEKDPTTKTYHSVEELKNDLKD